MDFEEYDSRPRARVVFILGVPVGLISDDANDTGFYSYVCTLVSMGFYKITDYIDSYPGKFKAGSDLVNCIRDYDNPVIYYDDAIPVNDKFQRNFFKRNYFWNSIGSIKRFGREPKMFTRFYEEDVLAYEPNGCMFLIMPTVAEAKKIPDLYEDTVMNRWFCSDWKG